MPEKNEKKLLFRIHELESELRRLREVMKHTAQESADIKDCLEQGLTQRAWQCAGALQRKLEVERAGGPRA